MSLQTGEAGNGTMKAAILYGREDLRVERVSVPVIEEDEVLLRVEAALTCGTDLKVWRNGSHATCSSRQRFSDMRWRAWWRPGAAR